MKKILKCAAAALGCFAVSEAGGIAYFYQRTMKRSRVKVERTMKMSGTDWNQYAPMIGKRKEAMLSKEHEDVYIHSYDGLRLHATHFPTDTKKIAICFHGYTSQGMNDYIGLSDYYMRNGYGMLLPDARAHGKSEGEYIGFGCLDRWDVLRWIEWTVRKYGKDVEILLHGTSMGGATVLMASGLNLPRQVKGIISDCGFTSAKHVFTHVLHSMYHLPAFPMIQISDYIINKKAGYHLDECNAAREVKRATVPILLIHGEDDFFVPYRMCEEIYENCPAGTKKLMVKGASHAESYYKNTEAYENALDDFIGGIVK